MLTQEQREALLNTPALAPPEGVIPNFENPPGLKNVGVISLFVAITTLSVWMRLYTRARVMRLFTLEDWLLLGAWLTYAAGFSTMVYLLQMLPLGVHQWNMDIRKLIKHLFYFEFAIITYCITTLLLKCAMVLQILRLFVPNGVRSITFWVLHVFLWINIVFYLARIFLAIFACEPIAKSWDVTIDHGKCIDVKMTIIIGSVINTLSDLIILLIPQRAIWRLNLQKGRKYGLSAVFLVAIAGCVCSAILIYHSIVSYSSLDMTYRMGVMGWFAGVELMCGFLVVCLPILPNFVVTTSTAVGLPKLSEKIRTMMGRSSAKSGEGSSKRTTGINIGLGNKSGGKDRHLVTDIEFHELVVKTNQIEDERDGSEHSTAQRHGSEHSTAQRHGSELSL